MAGDKNINIGVGADVSGLKTGMNDAAKLVQDAGTKMQTAAKDATTKTEQSFSNLRQAYRATARDAYEIALSQGTNSAAFLEATEKAGKFKDELDLVNTKIKAFSSDTPVLTSALGVGQGLAGAFAAAQGAMALFGGESDKLQEAMVKVQASMALVQGLTALGGLKDSFMALSAVITTRVVPAIASIGVTLSASGIGIAVLAIGALVMVYKQLSDESNKVAEKTRLAEKAQRDYNASVYDYLATDRQKEIREENMRFLALKKLAEDRKKLLDDEATDLNKAKFGDALKKRNDDYKKVLSDIENIEKQHQDNIQEIRKKYEPKNTKSSSSQKDVISQEVNRPDTNFNEIGIRPPIDLTKWGENLEGAKIPLENFVNTARTKYQEFLDETAKFNEAVRSTLESGVENAFINMAASIGNSLATSVNVMEGIGAVLLEAVGSMAIQLGQLAIQTGIAMKAIKISFKNPYTAIAAGIALIALGSFVSSKAKSITSGGGGGGNPPSPDNSPSNRNVFSGFTPQNNSMVLSTRLIGTDLLMSVQKAGQQNTRVR